MKEWVFKHVSDEEFIEGLRRSHVPEFYIKEVQDRLNSEVQSSSDVFSSTDPVKPSSTTQDFLNRK